MLWYVSATQGTSNVEDMVKDWWATRPRRPRTGRVVAGVAAGIGRRYAIDPVIVRVALVVSAVYGGAGVLFYLLGWVFLAGEEDEVSPIESLIGRGRSGTSKGLTVLLLILLIPSSNFAFGGHFTTIAGIVLLVGALYLLHKYRGDLGRIDGPATTAEGASMNENTSGDEPGPVEDARPQDAVPTERTGPPAWDPLGAAPFAWDLPEPTPVPEEQPTVVVPRQRAPRHRSRVGLATFGLVLVTGATLVALSGHDSWLTPPHIAAVLAAVTGAGLLIGAFTHSGRGLILLAVVLSIAGFAFTQSHFDGWHGAGDAKFRPTTLAQVQPVYQRSVGDIKLDLTALPPTGTVHTKVSLAVGDLTVLVPSDATVEATCSAAVGDVVCLGQRVSGPGQHLQVTQQGAAGNDLTIVLDVQDGPGDVKVASNG
jgi:phage shock protein PspC (stress-responsive transcriptional regulator)